MAQQPAGAQGAAGEKRWEIIRNDFPILSQRVGGWPLAYLDNAATTQKPRAVIEAITRFYEEDNANVHRGIHTLSDRATRAYEAARERVARFFDAEARGVVFVRGATEGLNLLAHCLRGKLSAGSRIVLTEMEHHSNLVPWQMVAERTGALLDFIPVDAATGLLDRERAWELLERRPALLALTHISNTLGTVNPVAEICRRARDAGVITVVDAAQSAGHRPVSLRDLECDFLVFSGHKMCGPMGIGGVVGRCEAWDGLPPWQGGGEMIARVAFSGSSYKEAPHRFEAGTPNVEGAIGLAAALDYLDAIGREAIQRRDEELVTLAWDLLSELPGVRLLGPEPARHEHAGVLSFVMEGIHAHDVASLADRRGIALRAGHHCTQPLMKKLGVPAAARASFYFYNTEEEVVRLRDALGEIQKLFDR